LAPARDIRVWEVMGRSIYGKVLAIICKSIAKLILAKNVMWHFGWSPPSSFIIWWHCCEPPRAVFFNLFWFTAPFKTEKKFGGTLTWIKWQFGAPLVIKELKKVVNSIFGGTPDTSSRHPCVPRHPGWEPLP